MMQTAASDVWSLSHHVEQLVNTCPSDRTMRCPPPAAERCPCAHGSDRLYTLLGLSCFCYHHVHASSIWGGGLPLAATCHIGDVYSCLESIF